MARSGNVSKRYGVAQRRKDPQRDGIATLWKGVDVISYGMEPQCFTMICKGEAGRGFVKRCNGIETLRMATAMLGMEPKRNGMAAS